MEARSDGSTDAVRRRIASLSPEKQQALERLLQQENAVRRRSVIPRHTRSGGTAPLSSTQRSLWILDQLDPGSVAYIVAAARRLRGSLDVPRLELAFQDVIRRHESLRTTFAAVDGEPVQVINGSGTSTLPLTDLRRVPPARRDAEADRLVQREAQRPFDLQEGPLIRASLHRRDDEVYDLLVTAHHIIFDGWSMGIFLRELGTLYAALVRGQPSPLPAPAIHYADYAAWQRKTMHGAVLEQQLAYWRDRLAGAPQTIELPTDWPRSATVRWPGRNAYFTLPAPLTEELRRLSRQEGGTLYTTLLAALFVLLARHSSQSDLVVGTTVATRGRSELEDVIGCFVNTLVLRATVAGNPTFLEWLARVRETTRGAFSHLDLPFEALVEELRPERDPGRNPLFQVLFALQNSPVLEFSLPGVQIEQRVVATDTAKFDLSFELTEVPQGLRARLEYRSDLFEEDTIARLWGHYRTLLAEVAADPNQRLSELRMLSGVEQQELAGWNATERGYDLTQPLHRLVAAQAGRTPEAVAVVAEGQALSYRALDQRANQLAHHLRARGVGPDVLVGVCLERSWDLVVALLAVLKAGGAYVPLEPSYPAERLAFMLADAACPVVIGHQATRDRLPQSGALVVDLDQAAPALGQQSVDAPAVAVGPAHLAYGIYTSGSTGRPKGALNCHRGIVNRLLWMQETFLLGTQDAVLQKTPASFDVSVWEFFWPLLVGARLVLARPEGQKDPDYLAALIAAQQVTTVHFVPSMLAAFLDAADPAACRSLRWIVCSGEALAPDLAARCRRVLPWAACWNLYGPTEAAVDVTAWAVPATGALERVAIGRPVANTRCYVLNADRQPVPVDVPGELYLGGVQVGRGYLARPALTAERFLPDPFGPERGARLYRTGDRVRWRADGALEYLGRLDQQVKLRGQRIELGEIELALRALPGVREAAVLLREDRPGDARLVGYLAPRAGATLASAGLRRALGRQLPEYMVPAAFVLLDALPLSPNGKLDRQALPPPGPARPDLGPAYAPPSTPVEEVLAGIWAEVLHLERVGRQDDFFLLGGHSLLATQVVSQVREALQVEVPLRRLFEARTVAELAAVLLEPEGQRERVERTAAVLVRVARLPDEEVDALLATHPRRAPEGPTP